MRILAIETACYEESSLALVEDGLVLNEKAYPLGKQISSLLLPAIDEMAANGKPDAIVVDRGPGSFTGIRTGLAAAQGLGLGWNVPVYGISLCDYYKRQGEGEELLLLNARAGGGFYFEHRPASGQPLMGYAKAEEIWQKYPRVSAYYGDECQDAPQSARFVQIENPCKAAALGLLALKKLAAGEAMPPEAIYLHCRITLPKKA